MAPADRATWLRSDRLLARSIAQPISRFLAIEASGGLLLVAAAVIALVWANSPWSASYFDLWHTELTIEVGSRVVSEDLQHWINDGLMTLFFFVIGLEIKHEVSHGQLDLAARRRDPDRGCHRRHGAARAAVRRSSTWAATARPGGASPWPPTSPSRSGCSLSSAIGSRASSRSSSSRSPSSTTSAPSW